MATASAELRPAGQAGRTRAGPKSRDDALIGVRAETTTQGRTSRTGSHFCVWGVGGWGDGSRS